MTVQNDHLDHEIEDDEDTTIHLTLHTGHTVKLRQIAFGMQPLVLVYPEGDGDLAVEVSGFDEKHLNEALPDLLEFVADTLRHGQRTDRSVSTETQQEGEAP